MALNLCTCVVRELKYLCEQSECGVSAGVSPHDDSARVKHCKSGVNPTEALEAGSDVKYPLSAASRLLQHPGANVTLMYSFPMLLSPGLVYKTLPSHEFGNTVDSYDEARGGRN